MTIDKFGHLSAAFAQYLQLKPTNHFEYAVVAVLRNQERRLTPQQKLPIHRFLIEEPIVTNDSDLADHDTSDNTLNHEDNFIAQVEETNKRQKMDDSVLEKSKYVPLYHVVPTSNCCERLFSHARLEKHYNRLSLSHRMFEARMMLNANKALWNPLIIDKLLVRESRSINQSEEIDNDSNDVEIAFEFGEPLQECPDVSDEDFDLVLSANDLII
jgi:hypothetical protein